MTAITGNTYPVRDQLKALGGRWNAAQKAWMVPDDKAERARQIVTGAKADRTNHVPGRATEKQLTTISKLLRRVENIRMFDSFSGSGAQVAGEVRDQIRAWGGTEKLTSRQASQLIDQLIGAADDEM